MSTMDINEFVQQQTDMTSTDRQELLYYIDNALNNIISSNDTSPQAPSILTVFGSTNSNDINMVFELNEEREDDFTRKIEEFMKMTIENVIGSKAKNNVRTLDMTFITTKYGQVNWANKGNVEELNNAIMATFKSHIANYDVADKEYRDCPVTNESKMDIGGKALSTVRQLLGVISRTDHGRDAKKLLVNKSFTKRLNGISDMLDEGIFTSVTDTLEKKRSDESLLKDVAFSFIQLDALLNDTLVPYSKNAVFNTTHTKLLPFIFEMANFTNDYHVLLTDLDELIEDTIDILLDRMSSDEGGILQMNGDGHQYDVRREKSINV